MANKSKTIKGEVVFEGLGVHSGIPSKIVLQPSKPGSGIVIQNRGLTTDSIQIGKIVPNVVQYATVLSHGTWKISTLEHLMAAIFGLGIDDLIIKIYGSEVPILDGSALPFVQGILEVGLESQGEDKRYLTPKKTLVFEDPKDHRFLEISPINLDDGFQPSLHINYEANFSHPMVGSGKVDCDFTSDFFVNELAPARTFGFLDQLPFLRQQGLAKGASLENTVVIGENGYLNDRRFEDEFVRHKLLDMLGDLALLGRGLAGKIVARRTGHNFNRLVVEHYINKPDEWILV